MASYTDLFQDDGFFKIEMENNKNTEKLPIELFREIEVELLDSLLDADSDDEKDGPINFIKQVVESVREEFDTVIEEGDKKTFIHLLSKILTTLLSIKADDIEKNNKTCKVNCFDNQWPTKQPYTKFKIKTLSSEQKTINIKKMDR